MSINSCLILTANLILMNTSTRDNDRGRVKSVEQGILLLKVLSGSPGAMSLKAIAASVEMPPSKAHRYLVSLMASGMVEQIPQSGHYRLGRESLNIGLAALAQLDLVQQAEVPMEQLCLSINETVLLSVWGNNGPTIIKMYEPARPVTVNVRVGFSLPLLSSASGHVFCANMPGRQIADRIRLELKLAASGNRPDIPKDREQLNTLIKQVKRRGLSRVKGALLAGINSLAAPVFDHEGAIVAALTILGAADEINISWNGPFAQELKRVSAEISQRLGYLAFSTS
jgi:DNA-binding IclR family transcriptional regulator